MKTLPPLSLGHFHHHMIPTYPRLLRHRQSLGKHYPLMTSSVASMKRLTDVDRVQNGAWVEICSYGPIHAFSTSAGIFIQGWHSCPEWPTRPIVPRGVSTRASVVFTAVRVTLEGV